MNVKIKQETSLSKAQQNNQSAAAFLRQFVGASFGPRGLSKLRFNEFGDIFVLQDCKTTLEKADFKHPIAMMMLDLAKSLQARWGDGSAAVVLLASTLIDMGFELVRKGINPSHIIDGFSIAKEESLRFLDNLKIDGSAKEMERVIHTFFSSKLSDEEASHLAKTASSAIRMLLDKGKFDEEMVKVTAKGGSSTFESDTISGIAVEAEVLSGRMPSFVSDAKIAIVEELLDVRKTKFDAQVQIQAPKFLGALQHQEDNMVRGQVKPIIDSGANVLLTHKGIEEPAISMLVDARMFAVRRIGMVDLKRIAKASGATIVNSTRELSQSSLGYASLVEQKTLGDKKFIFIEGCKDPRAVSIILKSPSQRGADSLEMLAQRAVKLAGNFLNNAKLVAGGCATEFSLYNHLKKYSLRFSGREQIAIQAFAEALLSLVEVLAKNCGMNPIDVKTKLASSGGLAYIDAIAKDVKLCREDFPLELLIMKKSIIVSATEVANTILRVGDVYPAKQVHPRQEREPDYP